VGDTKKALYLAWIAVSVILVATVVAPVVLPSDTIYRLAPLCEARARWGRACVLCGSTRAFVAIAHGDLATATDLNAASIPLYSGFALNGVLAFAVILRRFF
jgi:hypothetical protein